MERSCTVCSNPISINRLKAKPNARECTDCLAANDVPLLRQFDEVGAQTIYTSNHYIEQAITRTRNARPSRLPLTERLDATAVASTNRDLEEANI